MRERILIKFVLLLALLAGAIFLSLFYGGSEKIQVDALGGDNFIFWQIRVPKTITAIFAGATLAVAGLILQVIFRNPLAGPYVLGISSGAALLVALCMMAGGAFSLFSLSLTGKSLITGAAVAGSLAVTLLVLAVSKKVSSNVVLLLIGLMFSQICGAIQASLEYFADPASLKSFVIWGMGSLGSTTNGDLQLFLPLSLIALVSAFFFSKPLNALLLGQSYAQNAGINYKRSRFALILISSLLTGITTAFCGPIAFVGIAIPILSRMLFGTSRQQVHLLACSLLGSIILLLSDAFCHSLIANVALPINMVTTLLGAPLVIYLMFRNRSW